MLPNKKLRIINYLKIILWMRSISLLCK